MSDVCVFLTRENPFKNDKGSKIYSLQFIKYLNNIFKETIILTPGKSNKTIFLNNKTKIKYYIFKKKNFLERFFSLKPNTCFMNYTSKNIFKNYLKCHFFIDHLSSGWSIDYLKSNNFKTITYLSHNHEISVKKSILANNIHRPMFFLLHFMDLIKTFFLEKKILKKIDCLTTITNFDKIKYEKTFNYKGKTIVIKPYNYLADVTKSKKKKLLDRIYMIGSFKWNLKIISLINFLNEFKIVNSKIKLFIFGDVNQEQIIKIKNLYQKVFFKKINKKNLNQLKSFPIGLVIDDQNSGFKLKVFHYLLNFNTIFGTSNSLNGMGFANKKSAMIFKNYKDLSLGIIKNISNKKLLKKISQTATKVYPKNLYYVNLVKLKNFYTNVKR